MERLLNSKLYKIKNAHSLNNIYKIDNKGNNSVENKVEMNSRKLLNNKFRFKTKCNLLLKPLTNKNGKFTSMLGDYSTSINKLIRPILKPSLKSIDNISKDIIDNNTIHKLNILKENSSFINNLKRNTKKIEYNRRSQILQKSKSSYIIFDRIANKLPMIKPRQILINIYSGPYEFKIKDINKRNYSYKKFGRNSFYMGERYNPENYAIEEKIGKHRNYYGKIFAN